MARSRGSAEQQTRALELYSDGKNGVAEICRTLELEFEDPMSQRTVERWVQGFKETSIEEDSPYEWTRLDKFSLPWVASQALSAVHAYWLANDLDDSNGPFSFRKAKWTWRVLNALGLVDEVSRGKMFGLTREARSMDNVSLWTPIEDDILRIVRLYVWREMTGLALLEPRDTRDIDLMLAFSPWKSRGNLEAYRKQRDYLGIPYVDWRSSDVEHEKLWASGVSNETESPEAFEQLMESIDGLLLSQIVAYDGLKDEAKVWWIKYLREGNSSWLKVHGIPSTSDQSIERHT